ncbi:Uncharacterized protein Fot_44363 [Forsythia ovata]|uniref:Uncharacterized protein n=1 Tax=Forsythia ovata TaxID=205694 RepID=A0ABD1R6S5_9LAMI
MAIISDIVVVVIVVLPKKVVQTKYQSESCIQELVLMNEKVETTVLTEWDEFVVNQCTAISAILTTSLVILATNHELIFPFRPTFCLFTCQNIRVDDSIEIFETITSSKSYLTSRSKSIAHPPAEMIVPIEDVPRLLTEVHHSPSTFD